MAQNLQNHHVFICAKRKFLSVSARKKVIIEKPFFMLNTGTRKLR